jgi:hypothetical protein
MYMEHIKVDFHVSHAEISGSSLREVLSFVDEFGCLLFTGYMQKRDILWYLVFIGFAVNYMFRLNINIGIVSMVRNRQPKLYNTSYSSVCTESQSSLTYYNDSLNFTTIGLHHSDEVSCSKYFTSGKPQLTVSEVVNNINSIGFFNNYIVCLKRCNDVIQVLVKSFQFELWNSTVSDYDNKLYLLTQ